jgi:hypothetical protein
MGRQVIKLSSRLIVLGLIGLLCIGIGAGAAQAAPSLADLIQDGNIVFTGPGLNGARDIRTSDNLGGMRFYNGTALTGTPSGAALQFFGNGSTGFPGQAFIDTGAHNNAAIIFRTAGSGQAITERMRIDATGRVIVGTVESGFCLNAGDVCIGDDLAVDDDAAIDGVLHVGQYGKFGAVSGAQCSDAEIDQGDVCAGDDLVSDGDVFVGSGCVRDGGGVSLIGVCPSDARLKQNVVALPSLLSQLSALQPVTFDWRQSEYPDLQLSSQREYGLIAQQVEQVMPELVTERANGFKGVHYERLPILMLQGMRELESENSSLREQLAAQEARLVALEAMMDGQPLQASR